MFSSVVWRRLLPASSWMSEKGALWYEGKRATTSVGKAIGRPRRMYWLAA